MLNKELFDKKLLGWKERPFCKKSYRSIINAYSAYEKILMETRSALEYVNLLAENPVIISKDRTMTGGTILIEMKEKSENFPIELVSGQFFSEVFHGNMKDLLGFKKQFRDDASDRGYEIQEIFEFFETGPKARLKQDIVLFGRVLRVY
jgi:hypothetical protein